MSHSTKENLSQDPDSANIGIGLKLDDGSRIAVIGGGPAGSLASYFLIVMASRIGIELEVDIFESRDFSKPAPQGCNMCGGIVSESLVQTLATEGIELPATVVQRGIESYTLHMDIGRVTIDTPFHEKRIAAVFRGAGPKGIEEIKWESFDKFLLDMAVEKGATHITGRVVDITLEDGKPRVKTKEGFDKTYDFMVAATGVNTAALKLFEGLEIDYSPPRLTKTHICEYLLGGEKIEEFVGNSMHAFLLNIPNLEFAALIPKGDYATVCMLGRGINKDLVSAFLSDPEVKTCMPPDWEIGQQVCQCYPKINIKAPKRPFADRVLFVGDCGVSRLYKDGIGAAYKTAKAAATTAVFSGISAADFEKHFWPSCHKLERDNGIGKLMFFAVGQMKRVRLLRKAILRMVVKEQKMDFKRRRMSWALWDLFTGSAPYGDVLARMCHPVFLLRFFGNIAAALFSSGSTGQTQEA